MKKFRDYAQNQLMLLPPSLEEFVPEDHEARIVSDVVEAIDLSRLMEEYAGGGAPAYHPAMMLKVLIYAYSQGIYSSRAIARELKTNTAFMYLSGRGRPDFRTLCLFRAERSKVLPELFVEVVRLCAALGMVGLGHVAFDGTKLKANAAARRTRDREQLEQEMARIKEQVKEMIEASARIDALEDKTQGDNDGSQIREELRDKETRLNKLAEAQRELEREKLEKVNLTDPESRFMRHVHRVIQPSYNGQVGVDEKEQVIVAAYVTQEASDNGELVRLIEQVERNLGGSAKENSADAGYFSYGNLEYVAQRGLKVYMPDCVWDTGAGAKVGKYGKSRFRYDGERDIYLCPEGKELKRWQERKREGKPPLVLYRGQACSSCEQLGRCASGKSRIVSRDGREPFLELMRGRLRSEEGKAIYKKRGYLVEPVFGQMKWNRRKTSLAVRGLAKVNGEFSLMCLAHNMKKIAKKVRESNVSVFAWKGDARGPTLGNSRQPAVLVERETAVALTAMAR